MKPLYTQLSIIRIQGEQAEQFLQGQFTQDVRIVTESQLAYTALCNQKGRVIADGYLLREQRHWLLIIHESLIDKVMTRLQKYAQLSGCTLIQDPRHCIGHLNQNHFKIANSLSLSIEDNAAENDASTWIKNEIINHIPRIEIKTSELFTPHMLELHKKNAVSFSKGCYVGQEIVARTHYLGQSKRGIIFKEQQIDGNPGDKIIIENKRLTFLRKHQDYALFVG